VFTVIQTGLSSQLCQLPEKAILQTLRDVVLQISVNEGFSAVHHYSAPAEGVSGGSVDVQQYVPLRGLLNRLCRMLDTDFREGPFQALR
jgi:hypothetical protein